MATIFDAELVRRAVEENRFSPRIAMRSNSEPPHFFFRKLLKYAGWLSILKLQVQLL